MKPLPKVLICDDDPLFHLGMNSLLGKQFEFFSAHNGDEALAILRQHPIELVMLDIQMRTRDEGLIYIPRLLACDPDVSIVINSQHKDFAIVREAMRLGAADYLSKEFNPEEVVHGLNRVLERRKLVLRKKQTDFEAHLQHDQVALIGEGTWITSLRKTLEKIRRSSANVIITGETGTGKEVVARHLRKTLDDGSLEPYIAVDSATIQSSTAESLLFGHEKGAFTGADKLHKGIFEEANTGTVYLDEISNMPLEIQSKLLRVLQEQEIVRLGSSRPVQLRFRTICATNKHLPDLIERGLFKEDLFQRLNVIPIHVPSLRERTEDIPILLKHFSQKFQSPFGPLHFTREAIETLQKHPWPGNIRELSNTVAYLATMTDTQEIGRMDLPPQLICASRTGADSAPSEISDYYSTVQNFEKQLLERNYLKFSGNVSLMARKLGMDRSHLHSKLKTLKVTTKNFEWM